MKRDRSERVLWLTRSTRADTLVAWRHVWMSKCKRYRVIRSHIIYGEGSLPDIYYAQRFDPHAARWDNLDGTAGRHRTKRAAMRHCGQDAIVKKNRP